MEKNFKKQRGGIQLIVFIGVILILTIALFVIVLFTRNNKKEENTNTVANESSSPSTIATSNETDTGDLKVDITEQAKKAFNAQYEVYEGKEISGTQIKALERTIETNNLSDSEFQVEFVSGEIKEDSKYTVTLSYGDNGFVNKVEVK